MVNLPLSKNISPTTSTTGSVLAIMDDMKKQEQNLSILIGNLNSVNTTFSDDLVGASTSINSIMSQTSAISNRLTKQQSVLASLQSSASPNSTSLVNTLSGEVGQLKTITSQVSTQASNLSSIASTGINLGVSDALITKNLNESITNFSNKANDLVTSLNSHSDALTSVISNSQKSLSGILTNNPIAPGTATVQNMLNGVGVSDFASSLDSFTDDVNLDMVKRETLQKYTADADIISGSLDNLKSSVVGAITAKISDVDQLKSITNDLDGAVSSATSGFANLTGPMSQLTDISSQINDISSSLTSNLGSISTDITSGFTDQLSHITDITDSMKTLGTDVTSQVGTLTSSMTDSINSVGGISQLTGAIGGVDSLTGIADPAATLSSSLSDMSSLSRNLMTAASSLNLYADGLPSNNPISVLSNQLITVGQNVYTQTVATPDALQKLVDDSSLPHLNIGSIEKSIVGSGSDLTNQPIPNIALNVNMNKIADDLTAQILTISNKSSSIPGS